jgi:four helix bundle protein
VNCVKEADEIQFWVEVIKELYYLTVEKLTILKNECDKIVKMMTTYKRNFQILSQNNLNLRAINYPLKITY